MMYWSKEEDNEMKKYFNSSITEMTLYKKLHKINPKRTYEAMMRRIRLMKEQGYERNKDSALKNLKVGYLDIEATQLNASFGYMLSWYIKTAGKNEYKYSVIKKSEIFNYTFDKRVTKELLEAIKEYDVLYAHYGSDRRFDFPFIRTRVLKHGLEKDFPEYMEKFIMDTYPIARNKLKFHSNRLDAIANVLGITSVKKTHLDTNVWQLATVGHTESLEYVADHNKKDVQLLEKVHKRLSKFERPIYHSL